tara:strand:+ start:335 stop:613 length:279 start_codon:yes stop_codon:yes gene_type:complete
MDAVELEKYRRSPFVTPEGFEDAARANPKAYEELVLKDSLLDEYKELRMSIISIEKKLDRIINKNTKKEINEESGVVHNLYDFDKTDTAQIR